MATRCLILEEVRKEPARLTSKSVGNDDDGFALSVRPCPTNLDAGHHSLESQVFIWDSSMAQAAPVTDESHRSGYFKTRDLENMKTFLPRLLHD
jgi:hypothetical protein